VSLLRILREALLALSHKELTSFYFINPFDSDLLDGMFRALWRRTQTSPLETRYWS
jgi:hypothetical protein